MASREPTGVTLGDLWRGPFAPRRGEEREDPRLARARERARARSEARNVEARESIPRYDEFGVLPEREIKTGIEGRVDRTLEGKPFTRGAMAGFSLGYAPGSELARPGPLGSRPEVPAGETARYAAGYLAGSIPAAIATGLGTRAALAGVGRAARTPAQIARAARYLSGPASSARQVAAQNVAEGLGFSLATEPVRKLPEGVSRGESVALHTALGTAIDYPVGLALGRFAGPVRAAARTVETPKPRLAPAAEAMRLPPGRGYQPRLTRPRGPVERTTALPPEGAAGGPIIQRGEAGPPTTTPEREPMLTGPSGALARRTGQEVAPTREPTPEFYERAADAYRRRGMDAEAERMDELARQLRETGKDPRLARAEARAAERALERAPVEPEEPVRMELEYGEERVGRVIDPEVEEAVAGLPPRIRGPLEDALAANTERDVMIAASELARPEIRRGITDEQAQLAVRALESARARLRAAEAPEARADAPAPERPAEAPVRKETTEPETVTRRAMERGRVERVEPEAVVRETEPARPRPEPETEAPADGQVDEIARQVEEHAEAIREIEGGPTTPEERALVELQRRLDERRQAGEAMPDAEEFALTYRRLIEAETPSPDVLGVRAPTQAADEVPVDQSVAGPAGRETDVVFPDGQRVQARYRVSEAEDLIPSHEPRSFAPHPRAPAEIQGRQYHIDRAAQEQVVQHQARYDPERAVSRTQDVGSGPPTARPDGVVIAGNQRVMAEQLLSAEQRAGKIAQIQQRAREYGIPEEEIARIAEMRNPVLWREITDPGVDLTSRAAIRELNRLSDVPVGKAKDPISDAISRARRMMEEPDALEHLARTLETDQTLRSYLRTSAGKQFVDELERTGVVANSEIARFRDRNGALTEEGMDMVERLVQNAAIGDPQLTSLLRANARSLLNQLEHAYPAIMQAAAVRAEGWDLRGTLQEALRLHLELRGQPPEANINTIRDLVAGEQTTLLGRADDPNAVALAEFLEEANKNETKLAFHAYAKDARTANRLLDTDDLFGYEPKGADEAFSEAFGEAPDIAPVDPPETPQRDDAGFISMAMLRPLGGGAIGGLIGSGVGDDPEERIQNAIIGMGIGAAVGLSPSVAARYVPPRSMTFTEAAGRQFDKLLKQAHNFIRDRGGAAGRIIADDVVEIDQRFSRRVGVQMDDIARVYEGFDRTEQVAINKLVNGRPSVADADPRLEEAANRLRDILDRDLNDYARMGGRRRVGGEWVEPTGSGKAFPQVPNNEGAEALDALRRIGTSDPRVQKMAQAMVDEGMAADLDEAFKRMDAYHRAVIEDGVAPYADVRQVGLNTYLGSRRFELPESYVNWDPETLTGVIYRNALTIEGMRQWGPQHQDLRPLLQQVGSDAGEDVQGIISSFLRREFGVGGEEDRASSWLLGLFNNYETTVRLGGSPLSIQLNYGQQFTNLAHLPLRAQMKALKAYPPIINRWMKEAIELRKWAERGGHVRGKSALADLHGAPGKSLAEKSIAGFLGVVRSNEVRSALAARFALEADIQRVIDANPAQTRGLKRLLDTISGRDVRMEGGQLAGAPVRRLENLGINRDQLADIVSSGRRLSENEMHEAAYRLVHDAQFPMTLASKPIWWSTNPAMRLLFKFKTFGIRQTNYVYENVVKEATKGNVAPLAKFVGITMLFGELYHITRDLAYGSDRSVTLETLRTGELPDDLAGRLFRNFYMQGGLGMLMDLQYGIGNWITGPAVATLQNMGETVSGAGQSLIEGEPGAAASAMREFLVREAPAVRQARSAWRRVQQTVDSETGDYFDYMRLREQAFNHQRVSGEVGERAGQFLERTVRGMPDFQVTPNTMPMLSAANAIRIGDPERAAEHIAVVIRMADDPESGVRSVTTSLRNRSPLGGLSIDERNAFLSSLSDEERREARRLQQQWERMTARAIQLGTRQARQ